MTALSKRRVGIPERAHDSRGAVAVEFALVLVPLVMLLIGVVTTGISYSHALGLTNAVREGARFGATANAGDSNWATDVANRVSQTQFDDQGMTTTICVQLYEPSGGGVGWTCPLLNGPAIPTPATTSDFPAVPTLTSGTCVVRVAAARSYTVNFILGQVSRPMQRGSVARFEGTCP